MANKITFIGSGIIGSGLAVNAVMHGEEVTVWYRRNFEKLEKTIRDIFRIFTDNGVCSEKEADTYYQKIRFTMELEEAVREADLVQESIAENVETKREMYRKIQEVTGATPIIASSTSLLFPSALSEGALHPERILVAHPYNPAYLMPVIELCGGETASEDAVDKAKTIYEVWGKVPVICKKEVKGFICNEINQSATRIARDEVVSGVCSAEDMDKAIMYGPGLRMAILGQLMTTSLGVEGGFRNMCAKYNLPPNPDYDLLGEQMDEAFGNRSEEEGKTPEEVVKYRDRMIIEILKLKKLM